MKIYLKVGELKECELGIDGAEVGEIEIGKRNRNRQLCQVMSQSAKRIP